MHLKKVVVFQKDKQGFKFLGLQLRGFPKKVGEEALTAIPVVSIGSFYLSTSSNTTLSKSLYFSLVFFRVFLATGQSNENNSEKRAAVCAVRVAGGGLRLRDFALRGQSMITMADYRFFACGRGRKAGRKVGGRRGGPPIRRAKEMVRKGEGKRPWWRTYFSIIKISNMLYITTINK